MENEIIETTLAEPARLVEDEARPRPSAWQAWVIERQGLITRFGPLMVMAVFVVIGTAFWLTGRFDVESVGYPGVWFFSFIGAASVFVPVPGLLAVCVAASPAVGLNPLIIGVVAGSAEALGELTGYMAGMSGRGVFERNRFYPRFRELLIKRGGLILFFGSVVPNPLFDVLGIAAGSMLYPVRKFLIYVFFAKTIKSTGVAYACFWGITWVESLIR
jgi:membrane protein YqaA with SNARE-associated domain